MRATAHPQCLISISLITKPSRGSSSLVPVPSTRTHLLTYEFLFSLSSCLPSTVKPCVDRVKRGFRSPFSQAVSAWGSDNNENYEVSRMHDTIEVQPAVYRGFSCWSSVQYPSQNSGGTPARVPSTPLISSFCLPIYQPICNLNRSLRCFSDTRHGCI